jgi:branched-subunit amino acid aminotransferase/4-amino-4-deoxychorismate lyase
VKENDAHRQHQFEALAYLNGRFLAATTALLPLHEAGFVFGATVTDLCRTFRHRLFRPDDHLHRFRRSCQAAQVPQPVSDDELAGIAQTLVARNTTLLKAEDDVALVMFATPGPIGYYLGQPGGPGDAPPTLGLHTFPLPFARYRRLFREGAHLVVPPTRHVPPAVVDSRIKQRSRLHWWIAEREAQQIEPGASALLLNGDDHITETAAANFLLVRDGVVRTPPRSSVLGGISLQVVEELCAALGIPFEEKPLTLADALAADEAMLSCTSFCLAGVSQLNGKPLSWPGPILERLLHCWSQQVGLDIRGQILADG